MQKPAPGSPSPPPTLRRQFSWTLPANVIYGACNFLLLMTLNKWATSDAAGTEAAGRFNWAMAAASPLFMFANLRFRSMMATDASSENKLSDYFLVRTVILAAVSGLVAIMSARLFATGETTKALLVLVIAGVKAVEAMSDLCSGIQQRVERMDRIAASLTLNGAAMMGAFVTVYLLTSNIIFATLGMLAARIAVLAIYDVPQARIAASESCFAIAPAIKSRLTRSRLLLMATLPLGATAALLSLTSNIPKYLIPQIFDDSMLGIYGSLAVTIQAGTLIFRAVELPALPRLAQRIAIGDASGFWELLGKLVALFVAFGAVGCVLSLLGGGYVLSLLFNSEYRAMGGVLALVVVGTAIAQVAGIIESSLIAARLTAIQLPMHCLTVGLCFVLSWILIPRLEISGAVLAVTICRFPFIGIGVWLLRQKLAEANQDASPRAPHPSSSQRRAA